MVFSVTELDSSGRELRAVTLPAERSWHLLLVLRVVVFTENWCLFFFFLRCPCYLLLDCGEIMGSFDTNNVASHTKYHAPKI